VSADKAMRYKKLDEKSQSMTQHDDLSHYFGRESVVV